MAAQITQIRNRFLKKMNLSSVAEFNGNMQLETSYHLIDAFGSAIEASQDFGDSDLGSRPINSLARGAIH
jgi:hypothetical protein